MKRLLLAALILVCGVSVVAIAQSFARVSGTVQDASGALIPGVEVTATDVNTGVTTSDVTNETGSYNFVNLVPGTYKISAALPGFQTQTFTDARLGADQYRYNFSLQVATAATSVEIVESAATMLKESTPTVSQVLTQRELEDLPLVGNNVLNLAGTMAGVLGDGFIGTLSGEAVTFAGVSARDITTVRDGLMVQDVRYPTGITSNTFLNPDLVGEVRLILTPVDASMGRGNGSVQITTRSGTNEYRGSARWLGRNSALNANTFERNRANPPGLVPYTNNHEYTIAYGGPIRRNRTFFYALYDGTVVRNRSEVTSTVLTPCARNGIFRYFDFWNNGNVNTQVVSTGVAPARPVVDVLGNTVVPTSNPTFGVIPANAPPGTVSNGPYTGQLRYISVFGPLLNTPTRPDCSDAQVNRGQAWDTWRTQRDPSGYVDRMMAFMPAPNNYTTGDGLNTASIRWLRTNKGGDNLFGVGQDAGLRKQINVKFDHNFNQRHKANASVTYETDSSSDSQPSWPGSFAGPAYRKPSTLTSSFTSTLSRNMINEARFGVRLSGSNSTAPYDWPENQEELSKLLPEPVNGTRILPRMGTGGVNFQSTQPMALNQGAQWSYTLRDRSPIYTFADNFSWNRGKHSVRMGAELRLIRSRSETNGTGTAFTSIMATGGATPGAPLRTNQADGINSQNPQMSFLVDANATRARDLLVFLSGSLSSVNQMFFMMDPKKRDAYEDYRTYPFRIRDLRRKELSWFVQDDWKYKKNLTLNLGVRYEYYGSPFIGSGLTIAPVGGGNSLFGINGRNFDNWLVAPAVGPGALNFSQDLLTQVQFVGPNSDNPGIAAVPKDFNNFGPVAGFAWQIPWFGEGKTSLRGGYQITFQAGQNAGTLETAISNPPGSTVTGTYSPSAADPDPYLDLTKLGRTAPVPVPVPFQPVQTPPVYTHGGGAFGANSYTAFDPNYVSPYVQNLTLTLQRTVNSRITAEVRYVGTLSVKQIRTVNLNTNNFLRNPLFAELDSIRRGEDNTPLLNVMLNGINTCFATAGCSTQYREGGSTVNAQYGNIGTTVGGVLQTPAYQLRLHPSFAADIANGNYQTAMATLYNYNGNLTGPTGSFGRVVRNSGYFPENFFVANPQFVNASYVTNGGHSNYHTMQAQITVRNFHGLNVTGTYNWAKQMQLATPLTDPLDRSEHEMNGTVRPHQFRANGTFELPIGPGKLLLGNTSSWLARALERWQMGWIVNVGTGTFSDITAVTRMYGGGRPDIVNPIDFSELRDYQWGNLTTGAQLNANFFGPSKFVSVPDPQCGVITTKQSLNRAVTATADRCTLRALAMVVPAGTPGAFAVGEQQAVIVLQNPLPGRQGNLGPNAVQVFGRVSFDANASKTFALGERRSLQVRIDATNVLNHPSPGAPVLDINGNNNFGNVTTKGASGGVNGNRTLQGSLRLQF